MDLTFVFPCLDEENTLGQCIERVKTSLSAADDLDFEIVVADNGSSDRSVEIARSLGARIVDVETRGYGAALQGGIAEAKGEYVMFADADSTYIYEDALALYRAARKDNADMSIASRLNGSIEDGAMPLLHRYLGTPVLTGSINLFFRGNISDCNSGFRCVRRSSYSQWDLRSTGMEFIGEISIKSLKAGARIVEIPSGLSRGPADRVPHLRTWRDGMRNLLFILSEKPQFLEYTGLFLLFAATLLQVAAAAAGPVALGPFNIFDYHSQALLLLAALTGTQIYLFSCILYLKSDEKCTRFTRRLIGMDEGFLFFLLLIIFGGEIIIVGLIVVRWVLANFSNLNLIHTLLVLIHFLSVPGLLAIGLLGIHVFKKSKSGN